MPNAPLRQWIVMQSIPRYPQKTTTAKLEARLREEGIGATRRTIERDLNHLSSIFPITVDDRERPFGWSWAADGVPFDVPGMDPETALTFKVLEYFAAEMLPKNTLSRIAPHFERAQQVLDQLDPDTGLKTWPNRVRILPRGLQLQQPKTDPDIVTKVYQALLERRQFQLLYNPRTHDGERDYLVNPLGLLFRDRIIYLVCTVGDEAQIKQFAVHRMLAIEILDTPTLEPADFDMDAHTEQGNFTYEASEPITLKARFQREAAFHLYETPLNADQRLDEDGQCVILTATVLDSQPLRWWLRAFGPRVEVLGPSALRDEIASEVHELHGKYGREPVSA